MLGRAWGQSHIQKVLGLCQEGVEPEESGTHQERFVATAPQRKGKEPKTPSGGIWGCQEGLGPGTPRLVLTHP